MPSERVTGIKSESLSTFIGISKQRLFRLFRLQTQTRDAVVVQHAKGVCESDSWTHGKDMPQNRTRGRDMLYWGCLPRKFGPLEIRDFRPLARQGYA